MTPLKVRPSLVDKFFSWVSNSHPWVVPSRVEEDVDQGQNILACVPLPEVRTEDCEIFSMNLLFAADEVELQFGTVVVEVVVVLVVVAGVGTQLWLSWLNTSAELFHSCFLFCFLNLAANRCDLSCQHGARKTQHNSRNQSQPFQRFSYLRSCCDT